MLLKDKVCIVTGAGKGFGEEIAKEFYAQGAKLALITRSQKDVDNLMVKFDSKRVLSVCGDVLMEVRLVNLFRRRLTSLE